MYLYIYVCVCVCVCVHLYIWVNPHGLVILRVEHVERRTKYGILFIDGLYTKRTRAHTHRELIRKWRWASKGSSLEYI